MIFNQQVLQDYPATYIASLFVSEANKVKFNKFIVQYPTITVLDVDAMINQLRSVIKQVSIAIQFILILVILAGSLVLIAQVQATMEERQRDLAILRTLGAKGKLLRNSVLYEFVALGFIAGFLASAAMEVAVYILQTRVFEMTASFHFKFWLLGMGAGGLFVGLMGLLSCWRLLTKTALHRHVV
jgi:putative ABC transport system permease protein